MTPDSPSIPSLRCPCGYVIQRRILQNGVSVLQDTVLRSLTAPALCFLCSRRGQA